MKILFIKKEFLIFLNSFIRSESKMLGILFFYFWGDDLAITHNKNNLDQFLYIHIKEIQEQFLSK